ncbi:radical SAM protein [Wansuia hejianensis]|uniref:B12-binding domain-containing radical SAM protein n=1 Tax=Wansuia hejianensis TaxID=2763667 RepID=A0A926F362_9FIRM|nr:radical SAM protein [Wansuia hejianensis]MBC8591054.1 B12-binding domain-containing radical SAM protein [Wansuia hejianensis]
MRYEGSIYRPPSEARSLIIQATIGCSHNKCSFCSMYKDKNFRIRNTDDILEDISIARNRFTNINRVFLADGDALMIKTPELVKILNYIKLNIPECERIGIYASPNSIKRKSLEELKLLKSLGLDIAYLGLESGSDKVLLDINKGSTSEEIINCAIKLKEAGILVSITLISGLGGKEHWKDHAIDSAKAINKINPDYLGLLTLMIDPETRLYEEISKGSFQLLSPREVALETLEFLTHLDSEGTIFRSNHASNYISLRGTLNKDIPKMIRELEEVIKEDIGFKEEWMRRL